MFMKKEFWIIFCLMITLKNTILISTVILVHGQYESHSKWCRPGGEFFKELEKSARTLNQKVIPFSWSGLPTNEEITYGAQSLSKIIESYPKTETIILIGHGHGGNVINLASQILNSSLSEENLYAENNINDSFDEISIIISEASKNSSNLNKITTITMDKNFIKDSTKKIQPTNKTQIEKKYLIDKICLLSTPIMENFHPNLDTIKHIYNYYSLSDNEPDNTNKILKYPSEPRIMNLRVRFIDYETFTLNNPTYTKILNPIIAKWILFIPEKLQSERIGFFEDFKQGIDAEIHCKLGKRPTYTNKKN